MKVIEIKNLEKIYNGTALLAHPYNTHKKETSYTRVGHRRPKIRSHSVLLTCGIKNQKHITPSGLYASAKT